MTNIPFGETPRVPDRTPPSIPILEHGKYASHLDELDLTEDQQRDFLEALWRVMIGFVDMGFGVDSVQKFLPELADLTSEFGANAIDQKTPKPTSNFNDVAKSHQDDWP